MLRIGLVSRVFPRPVLTRRLTTTAPRFNSEKSDGPEKSEETKTAEENYYNNPQARQYHALMSNPVNKPYHGNKKKVMAARARRNQQQEQKEININPNSDDTRVQEVKTPKTALQLAQEDLAKENELKYYEVHEYKPKWYEFGGLLTNLDVDYAAEAERIRWWRKILDRTHQVGIIVLTFMTFYLIIDLLIRIFGSHFVRRGEMSRLQALENKISKLEVALELGKNWEPDFKKKQKELIAAQAELVAMQAEEKDKETSEES